MPVAGKFDPPPALAGGPFEGETTFELGNIDRQDGQDEQHERLLHKKRRAPVRFLKGRRPAGIPWERGRPARIPSLPSGAASASRKGRNGSVPG